MTRHPLILVGPTLALMAALVACAGSKEDGVSLDTGLEADGDTGADDTGDTDDWEPGEEAEYWRLGGALGVSGGDVLTDTSSLDLTFLGTDDDGGQQTLCHLSEVALVRAKVATPPEDVPLYGWWSLSLSEESVEGCGWAWSHYLDFEVGIGAMDPRLLPGLEVSGFDGDPDTLYGLYVREQPAGLAAEVPVFVFGVAGTPGNWSGDQDPVAEAPLPDGTYTLEALHLLPYTPEATRR